MFDATANVAHYRCHNNILRLRLSLGQIECRKSESEFIAYTFRILKTFSTYIFIYTKSQLTLRAQERLSFIRRRVENSRVQSINGSGARCQSNAFFSVILMDRSKSIFPVSLQPIRLQSRSLTHIHSFHNRQNNHPVCPILISRQQLEEFLSLHAFTMHLAQDREPHRPWQR